jgi:hypothetical protein
MPYPKESIEFILFEDKNKFNFYKFEFYRRGIMVKRFLFKLKLKF